MIDSNETRTPVGEHLVEKIGTTGLSGEAHKNDAVKRREKNLNKSEQKNRGIPQLVLQNSASKHIFSVEILAFL